MIRNDCKIFLKKYAKILVQKINFMIYLGKLNLSSLLKKFARLNNEKIKDEN